MRDVRVSVDTNALRRVGVELKLNEIMITRVTYLETDSDVTMQRKRRSGTS